jgi:predicted metalloendopeptidase
VKTLLILVVPQYHLMPANCLSQIKKRKSLLKVLLIRKRVKTDEHSPAKVRINGVVYNMPEFYSAFPDVKPGDKLFRAPEQRPVIW